MKKLTATTLLLFLIIFSIQSQLLWRVSGKELKHDSYLFGTHHLIPISFLDSVAGLYPTFNQAQKVVSEIVLEGVEDNKKLQQAAMLPDSVLISGLLSESDYALLDKEFTEVLKMGLKQIDRLHPAMILTFYQLAIYKELAHFDDNTKSDSFFQLVAAQTGIPVVGLETIDKQIALLFPREDYKKQAEELVEIVKRKEDAFSELVELNRLYKQENIDALYALNEKSKASWGIPEEESYALIDRRNIDWADQLPALIKEKSCFIAVGALHLPGENGLIKLLRKAGYKVTPVKK